MMKMTKKVTSRTLWLGRGTATVMGLAVVLALTVGLASTALAGTGVGARFDLGKVNTVNALSSLVGSVAGPSLKIDNNSTASGATALDLRVEPGKPPMRVNSTVEVEGLNVDQVDGRSASEFLGNTATAVNANRLDGQDSTFFAFGTNGKANDANNLDGKDSTAFFSGETYEVTDEVQGKGQGDGIRVFAECDPEDRILSGGYEAKGNEDEVASNEPSLDGDVPQAWFVFYEDFGTPNAFEVKAICADFPPLR